MANNGDANDKLNRNFTNEQRDIASSEKIGKMLDGSQSNNVSLGGDYKIFISLASYILIHYFVNLGIDSLSQLFRKNGESSKQTVLRGGSGVGKDLILKGQACAEITRIKYNANGSLFYINTSDYFGEILSTISSADLEVYSKTEEQISAGDVPKKLHFVFAGDGAWVTPHQNMILLVARAIEKNFVLQMRNNGEFSRNQKVKGVLENVEGTQSQQLLSHIGISFGEDTPKNNFELCKDVFEYIEELNNPDQYYNTDDGKHFKIESAICEDLKGLQTITGRGSGSSIGTQISVFTATRKNEKGDHAPFFCTDCFEKHKAGTLQHKCHHRDFMDEEGFYIKKKTYL